MGVKLFVGGLAWETQDSGLNQAFSVYGQVEDAIIIKDRETGRSKGFGFITFTTDAEADAAIAGMNGSQLDGRSLRVNKAEDLPKPTRRHSGDYNRNRPDRNQSSYRDSNPSRGRTSSNQSSNRSSPPIIQEIHSPENDGKEQSEWGKTSRKSWGNKNRRRKDNDTDSNSGQDKGKRSRRRREEEDWDDW